jgi:hypothetical protein
MAPIGSVLAATLTPKEESNMHKQAFTPDNAAMLLIDHQVGTMGWTHSHDINLVKKNALRLARIANAVGLPVVLTVSMEDQSQGPLVPELEQILPEAFAARIRRPGTRSGCPRKAASAC